MNNKLIFRILGALASALIIVSVFVPFVSVTGYSVSLWEDSITMNSIYLPIMIIIFGAIGVLFFSLNIKTEFAYMSTGAIAFFVVMQSISVIDQGKFNTLSIGYYFLIIGSLLTGIMAFLTNLKVNTKEKKVEEINNDKTPSMLDKIDKLYNETPVEISQISQIQSQQLNTVQANIQQQPINPVLQDFNASGPNMQSLEPEQLNTVQANVQQQPINPVLQDFKNSENKNITSNNTQSNDLDIFGQ